MGLIFELPATELRMNKATAEDLEAISESRALAIQRLEKRCDEYVKALVQAQHDRDAAMTELRAYHKRLELAQAELLRFKINARIARLKAELK